jgi:hypothetical protein
MRWKSSDYSQLLLFFLAVSAACSRPIEDRGGESPDSPRISVGGSQTRALQSNQPPRQVPLTCPELLNPRRAWVPSPRAKSYFNSIIFRVSTKRSASIRQR